MRYLAVFGGASLILGAPGAGAKQPVGEARAVVARLYRDFRADADNPAVSFVDQPQSVLARYLEPSLAHLLRAERACVARTQAVCRLDFAPLWASQDPDARDVQVRGTRDPAVVIATLTGSEGSTATELTYRLVRTRAGWRVHDIKYPGGASLRRLLTPVPRP
jgi:hypothetical protein